MIHNTTKHPFQEQPTALCPLTLFVFLQATIVPFCLYCFCVTWPGQRVRAKLPTFLFKAQQVVLVAMQQMFHRQPSSRAIGLDRFDSTLLLRYVFMSVSVFLVSPDRGSFKQDLRAVPPFPFYRPVTVDTTYYYTTTVPVNLITNQEEVNQSVEELSQHFGSE